MDRYPLRHSWFWERAPLIKILLPLIAGIICYDNGWPGNVTPLVWYVIVIVAGLCFAGLAFSRQQKLVTNLMGYTCLAVFFGAAAILLCEHSDMRNDAHWLGHNADANAYQVRLSEPVQEKERTWRLKVTMLKSITEGTVKQTSGEAFISIYKAEEDSLNYDTGDTLIVSNAHWQPIKNAGNPFEYDYAKGSARKGIYHQCFVSPHDMALYGKLRPRSLSTIDQLHNWSNRQLIRYIKDTATLGLLQAMILGDEHNFDPALRQAYSDTGVIHIVSISGSHVAMLFLLITGLLFWLRGRHAALVKYSIGITIVWVYILMAGAPPSAVRSGMMFSVVALGVLLSKEKEPLNTLFAAAILLLFIQPMWLFTVGFQLSFAAVLSLTLFYAPLLKAWPDGRYKEWWLTKWIPAGIAASLAAEILTAPLVVYYFHNLPLFVILANLLAAVLIGLCALVGGFAILVFSWAPLVAELMALLLIRVVHFFNSAMLLLQHWTFPSWRYLNITSVELIIIYCIIACIGYAAMERFRNGYKVALAAASVLMCLLCSDKLRALRQDRVVVYNAGRSMVAERLNGPQYTVLASKAADENYTTKAAHTGWRCRQSSGPDSSECFLFQGQRVLLLNNRPSISTKQFPVDVLIIPVSVKGFSAAGLQQAFWPKQIVLCGQQSRWYKARFADSCKAAGLKLHDVSEAGAFVLE